jgi:hypothetical protein
MSWRPPGFENPYQKEIAAWEEAIKTGAPVQFSDTYPNLCAKSGIWEACADAMLEALKSKGVKLISGKSLDFPSDLPLESDEMPYSTQDGTLVFIPDIEKG